MVLKLLWFENTRFKGAILSFGIGSQRAYF